MKPRKTSSIIKSFQELEVVLDTKSLPDYHPAPIKTPEKKASSETEETLFKNAMDGVKPIPRKERVVKTSKIEIIENYKKKDDAETLKRLEDLINYGTGFNVSDTPEYIEGTGYQIHPEIAKRLHRGDFSIQAHLDLHGLIVEEAREIFDQFLKWAVTHRKNGLLVTHGRGLSSPGEPVLKKKVEEWLTRGPWRKWVVAYSSARKCDGGAGATYILLRKRPISKKFKIKKTNRGKN
ncbi:MAG: DNA mismatch repair protein MutS [Deltaproteobacteria bacterium]|nr:DNA mismatch repair protein MutS [Deltaproteobacteria bacterium]